MEPVVIIQNVKTKAESKISAKLWDKIKNTSQWKGVFAEISRIQEPPEVTALKQRLNNP